MANVTLYTYYFKFAESWVFSKQLPGLIFWGSNIKAAVIESTSVICRVPYERFEPYLSKIYLSTGVSFSTVLVERMNTRKRYSLTSELVQNVRTTRSFGHCLSTRVLEYKFPVDNVGYFQIRLKHKLHTARHPTSPIITFIWLRDRLYYK